MRRAVGLLGAVASAAAAAVGEDPSFLFILGDDIGWADFRYNNGTAASPRITEWTKTDGTIVLQDFHTGGTVCSPTRATVLTGRNHFRDCVNYVYGCSDMSECVPNFNFAPQGTFTIGDAARAANKNYTSHFGGKWHLGSFFNDSEKYGGVTSSPISHGFDKMNATVEVSPTATTNCECNAEWQKDCDYGHNKKMGHCSGGPSPDPDSKHGCCFNYWWNDDNAPHGVTNLTKPSPDDDALYNADSFNRFIDNQGGAPFLAQISFHNCHVPFIGTPTRRAECNSTESCYGILPGAKQYSDEELDFYACLNEFDNSVGLVLDKLKATGYYENTMVWFTTDNGPEVNCRPEGRCGSGSTGKIPDGTLHRPDSSGAGSAGPLRGRKRDVWEGGHRVPGIISWPKVAKGPARVSWDPVVTMDFLATVMEVLKVERPASQRHWGFDGVSVMPILRGETPAVRGIGWMYELPYVSSERGYAFRYGKYKMVTGGISCNSSEATFNCSKPQLYDMENDYVENHDLADTYPHILQGLLDNFTVWYDSVHESIANESQCPIGPHKPGLFPPNPPASTTCTFTPGTALLKQDLAYGSVASKEECCGACRAWLGCNAAVYIEASRMRPTFQGFATGGTCHLKSSYTPKAEKKGEVATAMQLI